MIKKIKKTILVIMLSYLSLLPVWIYASCSVWWDIAGSIESCLGWTPLVSWQNAKVSWWLWKYISWWTNNVAIYLWVWAVLWIAVWSFVLVTSGWEDDKLTKWKWIIKWSIIWFVAVISASLIINLVIRIMYSSSLN